MAYESQQPITFSLPAAADYSAVAGPRGVVVNTSGQFVLAGVGVQPHGVMTNAPAAGAMARAVLIGPIVRWEVGVGGVSVGVPCCVDATGRVIGGATGNQFVGIPLETIAVNGVASILRVPDLGAHA